jgi:hypothetical protein
MTEAGKKNISLHNARYWAGKKMSLEHRKRLSESHKGQSRKHRKETKIKISESLKLKNNPNYIYRKIEEKNKQGSPEYNEFKQEVLKRDKHTCQRCGRKDRQLEVHHIKAKSIYPELTLVVSNGITLCDICHSIVDKHRGYFGPVKYKQKTILVIDYDGTITANIEHYRQLAFSFFNSGHEVHIMTACNPIRKQEVLDNLNIWNIKYNMVHFRPEELISSHKNMGTWKKSILKKLKADIFFDNEIKIYEQAGVDFSDLKTAIVRI